MQHGMLCAWVRLVYVALDMDMWRYSCVRCRAKKAHHQVNCGRYVSHLAVVMPGADMIVIDLNTGGTMKQPEGALNNGTPSMQARSAHV